MIIVEGKGLRVTDIRGREYLDATSGGVWSVMVGHGRESIAKAIYDQLITLGYYAGTVGNIPTIKFAAKLIELLPNLGKVYFSNSGSEANEKAFKIVRQLSNIDPARKGKYKILFRDRDYHGTTIGALSATGQLQRKQDFGPFAEGFYEFPHALCYRCPFDKSYPGCDIDCARSLEEVILKEGPDSHRRLHRRTDHRRRRHHRAGTGILSDSPGDLQQIRHLPDHGRGGLRIRPHR